MGRPCPCEIVVRFLRGEPWGSWGENWDYLLLAVQGSEEDRNPAEIYAARAAALI